MSDCTRTTSVVERQGGNFSISHDRIESSLSLSDCHFQSSEVNDVPDGTSESKPTSSTKEQTMQLVDENAGSAIIYDSLSDPSFCDDYTIDTELGQFLSRPVLIHTNNWPLATPYDDYIRPWDLYFNDDRIRKKIDNYSLLNCNLKIKIVINASPFYYGLALASYKPLEGFKDETIKNVATYADDVIPYSQRPHIWIYPQNNQGGEMTLPFFYHKSWLRINDRNQFLWMGVLNLKEVVQLRNANSVVGTDVSIKVYAWAENIKLTAPTNALALQASDEYMYTGPISAPASAIATITGKLENVPVIGPFMTATRALSSGISQFAAYFGYTNTQVIDDVKPFKDLPFHSMASSEIGQPTEKLTLDPKNELSVDPRIVGLDGTDELSIQSFVERESYIDTATWTALDATDTVLWKCRITPMLCAVNTVYRQMTPLAYSQFLFQYWRGDIIFRVRFIASKFHRGRARITWDPEGDIITDALTSTTSFTRIVDISEETDVEIRVPYMQAQPWLRTLSNSNTEWYGGAYSYTRNSLEDNGNLVIRVFTEQSSPVASADISVVVSVKGSDNFEYAAPKELPQDMTFYNLQSSDTYDYDTGNLVGITQNATGKKHSHRFLVNMGEKITSFRQLLRRASLSRRFTSLNVTASDNYSIIKSRMSPYPLYNGYDNNGINQADKTLVPGTLVPYNYAYNIPFNWIGNCFIGMRGSSTWHLNCDSIETMGTLRWYRSNQARTAADYIDVSGLGVITTENVAEHFLLTNTDTGSSGQSLTHQLTQTGSSVTVPMYNANRMLSTDPIKRVLGNSIDGSDIESVCFETLTKPSASTGLDTNTYSLYHNIGTDFNFLFFLNCPTIIVSPIPDPTV